MGISLHIFNKYSARSRFNPAFSPRKILTASNSHIYYDRMKIIIGKGEMRVSGLHTGHRERVFMRFEREGLTNFQPHEVLELLLFYSIPLRNVNPLAHRLMERFGSLEAVLNAPPEQLMEIPGLGKSSAEWLNALSDIIQIYTGLSLKDRPMLDRLKKAIAYGEKLFEDADEPELWILNLSTSGHLLHSALLGSGEELTRNCALHPLMDAVLRYHAQAVVVLQRRKEEKSTLTNADMAFTRLLAENLNSIGVQLMDNVVLTPDGHKSFHEEGLLQLREGSDALNEERNGLMRHWLD